MTVDILLDTNILVYAHDFSEPEKQNTALKTLDRVINSGIGVITTQVLAEFFTVVTKRIPSPLDTDEAAAQTGRLARSLPVLPVTTFVVLEALRGVQAYRFAFWDAQIWASARMGQIPLVLSEDFSSGAVIEGVRFENPFQPGFEL